MKKSVLAVSLVFSLVLFTSLVSAYWYGDLSSASTQIIQWIRDIFDPFFEVFVGDIALNQIFFARVLILILLFVLISAILRRISIFKENHGTRIIIAAVVSILGSRYITESEFIQGVLLPYGILAVALTVLLPFLILGYFVHDSVDSPAGRKFAWIIFIAVYLGMWGDRSSELGNANYIYLIGALLAAAAALFDHTVHEYFGLAQYASARRGRIKMQIADIEERLNRYRSISNPSQTTQDTIKYLEESIKKLYKKL